jgi:hypothetical protein
MCRISGYLVLILTLLTGVLKSQVPYEMYLQNEVLVNQNTFEFDVFIKSRSAPFELTSYQCAFGFQKTVANGGILSFSYITGSSGLSNIPSAGIGIKSDFNNDELTFASMPGSDNITVTSVKVGRFRLQNTNQFGTSTPKIINITWNFSGYISTILTGSGFTEITVPLNHSSHINSYTKVNIVQAIGCDTINANQHPGKTIDGFGFYDGDVNSRWVSFPTPKWIIYDLGYKVTINLTRFSFFNFEQGRRYDYNVQISDDMVNWQDVFNNTKSATIEFTDRMFDPVGARYVKLIMHANNQDQWASLWETEIWSSNLTPLPVELSNFSLSQIGMSVKLTWQTITEVMNYGFEIQRSSNQYEWDVLGFVDGYGNSNIPRNYEFMDESLPGEGNYYYRLKQIDTDGTFEFSPMLDIYVNNIPLEFSLSQNYPNPFNPSTKIVFSLPYETEITLAVFNAIGQKISDIISGEVYNAGKHEIQFDGSKLASGIYFYSILTENFSQTRKMMLLQ